MWNPFSKKKTEDIAKEEEAEKKFEQEVEAMAAGKDLGTVQKFMLKRFLKMDPATQKKMIEKAMTPENVKKHQGEILEGLEVMRKSGQMSDDQYRLAKKKLGIK